MFGLFYVCVYKCVCMCVVFSLIIYIFSGISFKYFELRFWMAPSLLSVLGTGFRIKIIRNWKKKERKNEIFGLWPAVYTFSVYFTNRMLNRCRHELNLLLKIHHRVIFGFLKYWQLLLTHLLDWASFQAPPPVGNTKRWSISWNLFLCYDVR